MNRRHQGLGWPTTIGASWVLALSCGACGARSALHLGSSAGADDGADGGNGGQLSRGGEAGMPGGEPAGAGGAPIFGGAGPGGSGSAGGNVGTAGSADRQCPPGTFSTLPNATECLPWTDCPPGTFVIREGASTSDRRCAPCPRGQTTSARNLPACQPITATQIAAGEGVTCALLSDSSVKCWGNGSLNGQGDGATIGDDEAPSSIGSVSLTNLPGVKPVKLTVGLQHVCVLLSNGSVTCWGDNYYGELGYGTKGGYIGDDELPSSVGPVSITTTPGLKAVDVAAGQTHTCALLSDGSVKCWGFNGSGQLGQGDTRSIGDDELPSSIGPISLTKTPGVTALSLGAFGRSTCALLSNGGVKCWGLNDGGQLGYGNTENIGDDELPSSIGDVPITNAPGVTVVSLGGGTAHTCALLSDGGVKCWGYAYGGRLGYGNDRNVGDRRPPASVGYLSLTTTPGVTATQLAVGSAHGCAILSDSSLTCWGGATTASSATATTASSVTTSSLRRWAR